MELGREWRRVGECEEIGEEGGRQAGGGAYAWDERERFQHREIFIQHCRVERQKK